MLKKLTSPYWFIAFAIVTKFAPKALERWLSEQEWWRGLPFDWLAIVFLAVGVGVVWEDLRNPHSNLRQIWRDWRRVFDVMVVDAGRKSLASPSVKKSLSTLRFLRWTRTR